MEINGTINRITNLLSFVSSVRDSSDATRINLANAAAGSFAAAQAVRVHLANLGATPSPGSIGGFFPPLSLTDETDNNGAFRFVFNQAAFAPTSNFYFVAYEQIGEVTIPGGFGSPPQSIPIFQPVYRSGLFALNTLQNQNTFSMFFAGLSDTGATITQGDVDNQIATITITGLTSLHANIRSNNVAVRGKGAQDADLRFKLRLRPSTSSDLTRIIKHEIKDYELDIPFPANLCVDYATIEDTVRDNVKDLITNVNETITAGLRAAIPNLPNFDEQTFFGRNSTVTCAHINFPIVSQRVEIVNGLPIPFVEREIALKMFVGFPQRVVP